jgi:hypothetical protein
MNDPDLKIQSEEFTRRRKARARVTAVLLIAIVILFYFITLARIGG